MADRNSFHSGVGFSLRTSVFDFDLTLYQGSQTQNGLGTALDHKSRRAAVETFKVWRGKVYKWFFFVLLYSNNILEHEFRPDNWIGCVHCSIKIKKYFKPGGKIVYFDLKSYWQPTWTLSRIVDHEFTFYFGICADIYVLIKIHEYLKTQIIK